ncbi:MAG TPA: hypothetical protein VE825_13240 [Terriglobales bacterium]|jgi:hypothetical protein|nr:hypothetical protein [Terriglobales bacterium]
MATLRLVLALAFLALAAPLVLAQQPPQAQLVPASCHVTTRPQMAFVPPSEYRLTEPLPEGVFRIGSEKLWTEIHEPEVWTWRQRGPGSDVNLTNKIFWYRVGYSWRTEPHPRLKVTGRRLDGDAPPLEVMEPMTHAIIDMTGRGAMLAGIYMPTPGCWEITGDYEGDRVSFVVWVVPTAH